MLSQILNSKSVQSFRCLSSDVRPTGCSNGSKLYEIDTDTWYRFDEENSIWIKDGGVKHTAKVYGENRSMVSDYLYSIEYNEIDSEYAKEYIRDNYMSNVGHCSSARAGDYFGRNYDWKYDDTMYFIVKVTGSAAKYASIGIAGGFSRLTKDFVESGSQSELYKVLPYATLDGINENGVVANINVVPAGDMGRTVGTNPTEYKKDVLCQMSLVRYILDNFATASEAVDDIVKHISVYAPSVAGAGELHLMVADSDNTYVIEFINNQVVVSDMDTVYGGRTFMTNFYLNGTNVDADSHIEFNSVTPYGSGLERYNIIADGIGDVDSAEAMMELMKNVWFTNAYKSETTPAWNTEFVSQERGLTVHSQQSDFANVVSEAISGHKYANRDGVYWQTCHTSVYDIANKKMYILSQEDDAEDPIEYSL